jgi:hypothetical protein
MYFAPSNPSHPRVLHLFCGTDRQRYSEETGRLRHELSMMQDWVRALRLALNSETEQVIMAMWWW